MSDETTTLTIHNYERKQLISKLDSVIERYEGLGLEEKISLFESFKQRLTDRGEDETEYTVSKDDFGDIMTGLEELSDTKASWLRSKLSKRAELSVGKMGFGMSPPFMVMKTNNTPSKPS